MSEKIKENERSLFLTVLETPAGQQVGTIFFEILLKTWNLDMAITQATKAAEENGSLTHFQIAMVVDGLKFIGKIIEGSRK